MNFVRSMYASVSAIFRGDKSLNKKRENPYINNDQTSKLFLKLTMIILEEEEVVQEESQNKDGLKVSFSWFKNVC